MNVAAVALKVCGIGRQWGMLQTWSPAVVLCVRNDDWEPQSDITVSEVLEEEGDRFLQTHESILARRFNNTRNGP